MPPVPKLPPTILSVAEEPTQIVDGDADKDVGADDKVLMVTLVLTHDVVLHVPIAFT